MGAVTACMDEVRFPLNCVTLNGRFVLPCMRFLSVWNSFAWNREAYSSQIILQWGLVLAVVNRVVSTLKCDTEKR